MGGIERSKPRSMAGLSLHTGCSGSGTCVIATVQEVRANMIERLDMNRSLKELELQHGDIIVYQLPVNDGCVVVCNVKVCRGRLVCTQRCA